MDSQQEAALVKHYRRMWAKRLRTERQIYRQGINGILSYTSSQIRDFDFIKSEQCVHYTGTNGISFETLQTEVNNARAMRGRHETIPQISLDTVDIGESGFSHCDCMEQEAVVYVVSTKYTFMKLSHAKRLIHGCSIKNMLRDARWKLEHQANGIDAKRYLTIIEKVNNEG